MSFIFPAKLTEATSSGGDLNDAQVDLTWGVKIPLRDGASLNATIYRPKGMHESLPVIFTLTPYIADSYHPRAMYFARNGYVFALVDCRGRGNSEGQFEPMANEPQDGYDVVEWLAQQPWSNGKITMWGGSYGGYDQWATLKGFPPHLETIVPVASAYMGVDFPLSGNITFPYMMQWLTYTSGVTPNANLFGEQGFWIEKFRELYLSHRPFKELDRIVGNTTTFFQKIISHSTPDAYWDGMCPTEDDFHRFNLPILTITGSYDDDQPGAMEYYRKHMQLGTPEGKAQHYLLVGPWDHPGTRTPAREVGGVKFAEACMLDMNKLHKEWYDWTLKGGQKPEFLKKRVTYYLMGAEEWKYADSIDEIDTEKRRLYLNSNQGRANDVFQSGNLDEALAGASQPDAYIYDPLDVRPAELEREMIKDYLVDQRRVLNLFGNGLVYHTQPFVEATEITGWLKLAVWVSLDVPDTDFLATVYEILADGSSIQLTTAQLRARYRQSLRVEQLVVPGEINLYEFNGFTFFSRQIARGSRLRLVFCSPNTIFLEKNYNSGGVVAEESEKDARTAHVTLYHDPQHPSYLELPVVS
ncbi:MAG: CocE/NonD family hydrolase [Chloroflexi bacterium]|nr:CocE/NonD family hydrolase [Chloroflexota bacterium]